MSFLYFAYGSNMLPARLLARCPSARTLGLAYTRGYSLAFSKKSRDGSSKATLVAEAEKVTPGVLFEIGLSEKAALDRAEGAGQGYDRIDNFPVFAANVDQPTHVATTYLATSHDAALKPYDWYLALVIAGAQHHRLGEDDIERLRQVVFVVDLDTDRPSRRDALAALTDTGIADYRALLSDQRAVRRWPGP